jgi:SET domain-containing protein
MLLSQMPNLYIINHPLKGRCVHCAEDIQEGSVVEVCPLIILSAEDAKLIHQTHLYDYYFAWEDGKDSAAIALGYGSLYNHATSPNAEPESIQDRKEIRITAIKDIPAGTEITINYQGASKDSDCVIDFDVVE